MYGTNLCGSSCLSFHVKSLRQYLLQVKIILSAAPLLRYHAEPYQQSRGWIEEEIARFEPCPLPKQRKRRLSMGERHPQATSAFLTRLPFDIRYMIYKIVLQHGIVHRHVTEQKVFDSEGRRIRNRIRSRGCTNTPQFPDYCWYGPGVATEYEYRCVNADDNWIDWCMLGTCGAGPLTLTKICRQIYGETIEMLYC